MSTNRQQILDLCVIISKHNNLKCVFNQQFKIAAITLAAVTVGGFIGGARGLAAGATAAAIGATFLTEQGKSLEEILKNDLSETNKNKLVDVILSLVRNELIKSRDFNDFVEKVMNDWELEELVVVQLKSFCKHELNIAVV